MNEFSSWTNMIAVNAAIRASKLSGVEGDPFQVLAKEIQHMSSMSKQKLSEMDE